MNFVLMFYPQSFIQKLVLATSVELRSINPATRFILDINSVVTGIDGNGHYHFTVD